MTAFIGGIILFEFTGEKCRLRPMRKEDKSITLPWRSDPEIIESIVGYRFPVTEVSEDKWYDSVLNDQTRTRAIFAIEDLQDNSIVGHLHLNNIDWIARTSSFGIVIGDKDKQGQGIGTEATRILLRYGFDYLNLRKINLEVTEYNERAQKTYEKIGFKIEGILKDQVYLNNQYYDIILMSLFNIDFKK